MSLLRTLFLIAAKKNFTVSLKHLPGKVNEIANALPRKQFTRFFHLAPQAQQLPTPTPWTLRVL
jgi:predicted peptidase